MKSGYGWDLKEVMKVKIDAIEIFGYGKWVDKRFESLEQLQLFYGANESGKSTLMAFVHSILFGFPAKQSSEQRYEPKKSGQYGGRLYVSETPLGKALIERKKGKANGEVTVTLSTGEVGSEELLKKIIFGIDKVMYQGLFSFDLSGIQKVSQMNRKRLNRYFLSVGTLENDRLLKTADHFQKNAAQLYKQTGRVPEINQKIKQVEAKEKQIHTAKEKNNTYIERYKKKESLIDEIAETKKQRDQLEKQLIKLNQLAANWQHFIEVQRIQQQINNENLDELPEDGLYSLNQLNQKIEDLTILAVQEQERFDYEHKKKTRSKKQQLYKDHQMELKQIMQDLDGVKSIFHEKEFLEKTVGQQKKQAEKEKAQLALMPNQQIPPKKTEEQKRKILHLAQAVNETEEQKRSIAERIQFLNFQNQALNKQLDKLEPELWDKSAFQNAEKQFNKAASRKKADSKEENVDKKVRSVLFTPKSVMVLAVVSIIFGFFFSDGLRMALVAAGIFFLLISLLSFLKKQQTDDSASFPGNGEALYGKYIRQIEIRKQWREKLAEIDQVALEIEQLNQESEAVGGRQEQLSKEVWAVKNEMSYPNHYSLTDMVKAEDPFENVRNLKKDITENERKLKLLLQNLDHWKSRINYLRTVVYADWSHFPSIFDALTHFYQEATAFEQESSFLEKKEKEQKHQLEQLLEQIRLLEKERKKLLHRVSAKNEQEFREKYILSEQIKQKSERLNLLKGQLSSDLTLFESFRDREDLNVRIDAHKKQIQQSRTDEEEKIKQKINYEVALKNLEEGGEYSVLLQEFANLKGELQELIDQWAIYKVSADLIERTLIHGRKDRFPETISDAVTFFKLLTENQYLNIFLKEDRIEIERNDGTIYDATELSQGTSEQLYVALRLAFIKNTSDLIQLPLLIDDGFVNFDPERKMKMFQLIQHMSKNVQILYFTFDPDVRNVFRNEQIEML